MADTLIIVESPSKATTIKKFLGTKYNVIASMGHVRDLPKSKIGVDIEHDFEPEYINIKGKSTLIKSLKSEQAKVKNVLLATDPDREGEAIAWHLAYVLGIDLNSLCRVTFNEITKETVNESVKEPRKIDMDLTNAQQARRVLDRIVGYKLSPVLWQKVKRGLSAGRVQSVAVKLICDREEEIEKFVPEEYWNINAIFYNDKDQKFLAKFYGKNGKKVNLHKKEEVDEILNDLKDAKYIVTDVKLGERKKSPAPPFTTSTMQQEASRKLGFPLRKTMQIAQMLYEGIKIEGRGETGLITYMRTDSTRISEEARAKAKEVITKKYGNDYYENRYYRKNSNSQDAHEGIRPTIIDLNPLDIKSSLTPDQFKLYNLIYNRFLASQMANAVYDTVQASIDSNNSGNSTYNFKANGQTLKFKGFMTLYVEDRDDKSDEDDEQKVPVLKVKEEVYKDKLEGKQSFTEPPPRYTEASLVKTLEEKGIGRPSTYATIIATIIDREYIEKNQKQLVPTELGKTVNSFLVSNFQDIINVEFTADIENQFDKIANGDEEWKKVIRDFYKGFSKELGDAAQAEHIKMEDEVSDVKCEKCGRMMVIKKSRFGRFLACPGFPECKNTKPIVESLDVPCPVCGGKVIVKTARKTRTNFYVCENNPDKCNFISWNKPKAGEPWSPEEDEKKNKAKAEKRAKRAATKKKSTTKKKK